MNRTVRATLAVVFIFIIMFCAIHIVQNLAKSWKMDVTEQGIYTLSDGTKAILEKLNQPIRVKLYYAKTAALEGPDQIRFFNNYYYFVRALLEEYESQSNGMVDLEIIDPRPYSEAEEEALRYGLQRFPITEDENFFFGLVVQTQFGVEKVIPFFSPDRQNFVEYDISYLIDTAITRQKTRVGVLSSLPVTGEELTPYMQQMMMMQGQRPKEAWGFVKQLREQYEVTKIAADATEIEDVDTLLVIHPKELSEQTLFAIDQYVLKGGSTIICVDPHSIVDRPEQAQMQMRGPQPQNSNLPRLLRAWGLEMPENTFAGDRGLAVTAPLSRNQRPSKVIGFLELTDASKCFNENVVMTGDLQDVRMLFAGVLRETELEEGYDIVRTPLLQTTNRGNSWTVSSPYELMMPDPARLMSKFIDGTEPVTMGYMVSGKLKSAFPDGIQIVAEEAEDEDAAENEEQQEAAEPEMRTVTGIIEAQDDCTVIVFSDVDFISDMLAFQQSFFGSMAVGDNAALLVNGIEQLTGSPELISIRSRGNYRRPFTVVDEIELQAEAETLEQEQRLQAEIAGFEKDLQEIVASGGEEEMIGSSILQKKKELELKIREAQRQLRQVRLKKREGIEKLGNRLRNINMLLAPTVILVIAIGLAMFRNTRKRYYISHTTQE